LHYLAYFYAREELVLPEYATFLVTTIGEDANGSGYMWKIGACQIALAWWLFSFFKHFLTRYKEKED
jgi:hypothetical protein